MGLHIFSRTSCSSFDLPVPLQPGNPDPRNYTIDQVETVGGFLIVGITYPDCTNYEGKKILVFRDMTIEGLMGQVVIDPHFSDNKQFYSPVARFEPTEEGWAMARGLAITKGDE